ASDSVGPLEIGINHADQPHRLALPFQLLVNSGVIAPEHTHTNHRDGNWIVSLQEGSLGWLVATGTTNCKR
ncbi:MAG TPA: hypothetical protein VNO32_53915, partial [Candidatus Acidoferrum sp.]|nr:hypothetical protein [Candidatus Acidoferrum sp.]